MTPLPTPIRVVQYGLGPIGLSCVRTVLEKQSTGRIELVGAIDIDPNKVGRTIGELTGDACNVVVSDDAQETLHTTNPHVVLHTTSSSLQQIEEQLKTCVMAGANVVSSSEQLFSPYENDPEVAGRLAQYAETTERTIVGTGVNPGYAMDLLALMATGVCTSVRQVGVVRRVDAGQRRLPLQQKVGAGLTRSAFVERKKKGSFGHVGLVDSCRVVVKGLGWSTSASITETLEPVIASKTVTTPYLMVQSGQVAGIHQVATATVDHRVLCTLELYMYVGAENACDQITIEGDPPIKLVVEGGIFGDTATVGALINAIPAALNAAPGLQDPLNLPTPRCFLP